MAVCRFNLFISSLHETWFNDFEYMVLFKPHGQTNADFITLII